MTDALAAQIRAARPEASSWVAANAGSGKTRVLIDRVARLLLGGADPARVLCLTYTRAAAAEMQTRLFRTLGAWAMAPEEELRAAIDALGEPGAALHADRLEHARTLFARALETPGGLKIQTIHAFCDALLRRFPLEAGTSPGFAVLEDRAARALRADTLDALAAADAPAFAALAARHATDDFDPLLQEIGRRRALFAGRFDRGALAAALGVDPEAAGPTLPLDAADVGMLRALAAAAAAAGGTGVELAADLGAALAAADPDERQRAVEDAVLTRKYERRKNFPVKAVRQGHPALAAAVDAFVDRLLAARETRLARAAFERGCAVNDFARVWLDALAKRKAARGVVDFDDLIDRAQALLAHSETAAWVLWRLDGGIDHVLVDEAQDTSPAQWRVIEAITAEFFAGAGARETPRTVFVVGDEKQSIYSFQGADPAAFGAMRDRFERMLADMDAALARCDLIWSFRSAPPILGLVDAVLAGPAGAGVSRPARHRAGDPDAPGRVEVWPFADAPEKPDDGAWDDLPDTPAREDPVAALAARVADEVGAWLAERRALPGDPDGRTIRPGDVLILVQRRGPVFEAVIRALKRAGVPVAGADVLRIGAELAVRDLLAALRVAATPADDLSLAAVLRSPLGGLGEAGLYRLAQPRPGRLWDALAAADPAPPIREALRDLRSQADFLRPYELLQRLLVRHDGRRRLIARLGVEAEDGVDALLDQALAYESVEPPTLTGFLAWIDRDEVAVKRRAEEAADQVRVMTVHGAKGLEAPIVILPDTAARQEGRDPPQLLPLGPAVGWRTRAEDRPAAIAAAEAARQAEVAAENHRLLYVALTRARTWLIVAGAGPTGDGGWHRLVADAMAGLGPVAEEGRFGPRLALGHNWTEAPGVAARPAAPPSLPAWALRPPPAPPPDALPLAPSALGGAHALPGEGLDEAAALARGADLHLLLEVLPAGPRADWPGLARRLLPARTADAREDLLSEAVAVLDDPGLAGLFGPDALAEAEVAAPLAALGGRRIVGRVDRLVIGADRVLAVDFKSNRVAPPVPEATPDAILRQMGAYAAALAAVYPGRRIETAVLWTRHRRLMALPGPLVAAALARAGRLLDPAGGAP
jgi:ATP-dependent helicase/nuclease subunit A